MHNKNTYNIHTQKFKVLTVNVNGLNNHDQIIKIFNSLKTKKNGITLLQETHSTKRTKTKWQQEWNDMSFWNSGPTYHSPGVAILFSENFKGKIQNMVNDNAGRIITITFTLNKQNFHITILYGPNKPHHRESFFQSLTNHITCNQNIIIDGDFNMVTEFRDKTGGTICNTHLLGSIPLNELLKNHNLQDTWRKIHLNKINYTYHRTLSNIHSRFDKIYSSQNLNLMDSKTLPFQYSDHDAVFPEFLLRVRTRGPGYWK